MTTNRIERVQQDIEELESRRAVMQDWLNKNMDNPSIQRAFLRDRRNTLEAVRKLTAQLHDLQSLLIELTAEEAPKHDSIELNGVVSPLTNVDHHSLVIKIILQAYAHVALQEDSVEYNHVWNVLKERQELLRDTYKAASDLGMDELAFSTQASISRYSLALSGLANVFKDIRTFKA